MKKQDRLMKQWLLILLVFGMTVVYANGEPPKLSFADHSYVNPFTGGVAWETENNADVLAMEWAFIGLSDVLPLCSGAFDWSSVDDFLTAVDGRGHQAILRPIVFGPGYGQGSYAPSDMMVNAFVYNAEAFDNPAWDDAEVQTCILRFIDAFALRYKDDQRIAYIQMGLAGLWGEHHLDGATYTTTNFPSFALQKTMVEHYINGFGGTSADLLTALSLDSAQDHGFFGILGPGGPGPAGTDKSLDQQRFSFFDDSLLIENHAAENNWRQQPAAIAQLALHMKHGWGGEAFWLGCNSNGSWTIPPNDCGNGETLGDQAQRIGLNYMLGSPAYSDNSISAATLLNASQMMGYKFTATAVNRVDRNQIDVTVENTGAAYCPYAVQVCTDAGCAGDLSTLEPGESVIVAVPASRETTQTLFLTSPRLNPNSSQKIRWSNASADDEAATLTVEVFDDDILFKNGFESD